MSVQLTAKVSLDFLHYTPEQKVSFGAIVIPAMTANSSIFTTPDESMAHLTTVNGALNTANIAAANGDHLAVLARKTAETNWNTAFKSEASYVSNVAKGDLEIIAKSGFHATHSEAHPVARPGKAHADAWGNKTHGSIHAEIKTLPGSKGTLFFAMGDNPSIGEVNIVGNQISFTVNGTPVVLVLSTKHEVEINGLEPGLRLNLGAIAFNAAGLGDPSDEVVVIVP